MTNKDDLKASIRSNHLFRKFKLSNGEFDNDYFDLYPVFLRHDTCATVVSELAHLVKDRRFDSVGCIEMGPVSLLGACIEIPSLPDRAFIVRKRRKGYGTNQLVEGNFRSGDKVLLIEDVIASGSSIFKAVQIVEDLGGEVASIIAVINRHEGCDELLAKYDLDSVFSKEDFV